MLVNFLTVVSIAVCSMIIALTQYSATRVPGRIVFWPLFLAGLVVFIYQKLKEKTQVSRRKTDKK